MAPEGVHQACGLRLKHWYITNPLASFPDGLGPFSVRQRHSVLDLSFKRTGPRGVPEFRPPHTYPLRAWDVLPLGCHAQLTVRLLTMPLRTLVPISTHEMTPM